jgi:hypothetical protein
MFHISLSHEITGSHEYIYSWDIIHTSLQNNTVIYLFFRYTATNLRCSMSSSVVASFFTGYSNSSLDSCDILFHFRTVEGCTGKIISDNVIVWTQLSKGVRN